MGCCTSCDTGGPCEGCNGACAGKCDGSCGKDPNRNDNHEHVSHGRELVREVTPTRGDWRNKVTFKGKQNNASLRGSIRHAAHMKGSVGPGPSYSQVQRDGLLTTRRGRMAGDDMGFSPDFIRRTKLRREGDYLAVEHTSKKGQKYLLAIPFAPIFDHCKKVASIYQRTYTPDMAGFAPLVALLASQAATPEGQKGLGNILQKLPNTPGLSLIKSLLGKGEEGDGGGGMDISKLLSGLLGNKGTGLLSGESIEGDSAYGMGPSQGPMRGPQPVIGPAPGSVFDPPMIYKGGVPTGGVVDPNWGGGVREADDCTQKSGEPVLEDGNCPRGYTTPIDLNGDPAFVDENGYPICFIGYIIKSNGDRVVCPPPNYGDANPPGYQQQPGPPPGDMGAGTDPATGLPIDPKTGLATDPQTGQTFQPGSGQPAVNDPQTGQQVDPQTGQPLPPIDPQTGQPLQDPYGQYQQGTYSYQQQGPQAPYPYQQQGPQAPYPYQQQGPQAPYPYQQQGPQAPGPSIGPPPTPLYMTQFPMMPSPYPPPEAFDMMPQGGQPGIEYGPSPDEGYDIESQEQLYQMEGMLPSLMGAVPTSAFKRPEVYSTRPISVNLPFRRVPGSVSSYGKFPRKVPARWHYRKVPMKRKDLAKRAKPVKRDLSKYKKPFQRDLTKRVTPGLTRFAPRVVYQGKAQPSLASRQTSYRGGIMGIEQASDFTKLNEVFCRARAGDKNCEAMIQFIAHEAVRGNKEAIQLLQGLRQIDKKGARKPKKVIRTHGKEVLTMNVLDVEEKSIPIGPIEEITDKHLAKAMETWGIR